VYSIMESKCTNLASQMILGNRVDAVPRSIRMGERVRVRLGQKMVSRFRFLVLRARKEQGHSTTNKMEQKGDVRASLRGVSLDRCAEHISRDVVLPIDGTTHLGKSHVEPSRQKLSERGTWVARVKDQSFYSPIHEPAFRS
jgi:hypothetical protein